MNKVLEAIQPKHFRDIALIRSAIPELERLRLSDIELEIVWKAFSSDLCAGYMNVSDGTLQQFREWCDLTR